MAINLITQPDATVPITGADYTQQNLLINAALAQGDEVLTDWAESTAAPAIKQGVYFYHSGNSYQVQDSDSSISGTPVSGANYIGLAESGGVLTASYITDISGYTWNPAYNGLYNGSTLIIRAVTYLIGSAYHRALGADKAQSGMFILADGSFVSSAGQFNLGDKDIVTTGNITSGDIITSNITSDDISCGVLIASGSITPKSSVSYVSSSLPAGGTVTLSRGIYMFYSTDEDLLIEMYANGTWLSINQGMTLSNPTRGGCVFSNGSNARIHNYDSIFTHTYVYWKY